MSLGQKLWPACESLMLASCLCLVLNPHLLPAKAVASTLQWGSLPHSCGMSKGRHSVNREKTWSKEEKAKTRKAGKSAVMEEQEETVQEQLSEKQQTSSLSA